MERVEHEEYEEEGVYGTAVLGFFSIRLPYKGLMGTCGQPGYVFRDFCLKQGIEFIIFCLNQGIDLSIFVLNRINVLNRVSSLSCFVLIRVSIYQFLS